MGVAVATVARTGRAIVGFMLGFWLVRPRGNAVRRGEVSDGLVEPGVVAECAEASLKSPKDHGDLIPFI